MYFEYCLPSAYISVVNMESLQDRHDKGVFECCNQSSLSISDSYLLSFSKTKLNYVHLNLVGRLIGVNTNGEVSSGRSPQPLYRSIGHLFQNFANNNFGTLITGLIGSRERRFQCIRLLYMP